MAVDPILGYPLTPPTGMNKTTAMNDLASAVVAGMNAQLAVDMSSGDVTLSDHQFTYNVCFNVTGATAVRKLTIPLMLLATGNPCTRLFGVRNMSGSHALTVGGTSGLTVSLAASAAALIQSDGTDCIVWASGAGGPAGPTGSAGGAISIGYQFSTTVTNSDPGSGVLRLNNATQNAATAIYVDPLDANATDWTSVLDTLDASSSVVKGQIRLFNTADLSKWIVFNVTARTSHTGYREFTVAETGASGATPFADLDAIQLVFTRSGDAAASILGTSNIWTGRNANTPLALTDAAIIVVDFSLRNNFSVTLGGNRILGTPSGQAAGQSGVIALTQDGTGGRTIAPGANWDLAGGGSPSIDGTPGAIALLSYYVVAPGFIRYTLL